MGKVLDCRLKESDFKLQLYYNSHFWIIIVCLLEKLFDSEKSICFEAIIW